MTTPVFAFAFSAQFPARSVRRALYSFWFRLFFYRRKSTNLPAGRRRFTLNLYKVYTSG